MSDAAECLHEGRFLRLVRSAEWEYVERVNVTGVAVLVPVTAKGEIVLVVTLGDVLAPLVEELHGSKNIPAFGPDDYDDIYIVTIPWFGKVKTLRMHYGFYEPPGAKLPSLFSSSDDLL